MQRGAPACNYMQAGGPAAACHMLLTSAPSLAAAPGTIQEHTVSPRVCPPSHPRREQAAARPSRSAAGPGRRMIKSGECWGRRPQRKAPQGSPAGQGLPPAGALEQPIRDSASQGHGMPAPTGAWLHGGGSAAARELPWPAHCAASTHRPGLWPGHSPSPCLCTAGCACSVEPHATARRRAGGGRPTCASPRPPAATPGCTWCPILALGGSTQPAWGGRTSPSSQPTSQPAPSRGEGAAGPGQVPHRQHACAAESAAVQRVTDRPASLLGSRPKHKASQHSGPSRQPAQRGSWAASQGHSQPGPVSRGRPLRHGCAAWRRWCCRLRALFSPTRRAASTTAQACGQGTR